MFLKPTIVSLKRISLGTMLCTLLSSCGGDTLLSSGGIGGSGISNATSIGMITGFGSIWVNGVRYDVSNARFSRDGLSNVTQSDYRLGEIVTIRGSVNADGVSGIADSVEFDDVLEGTISQVNADGTTIHVLGETVLTDSRTISHGFATPAALQPGNVVEISGYRIASEIKATSITLKQTSFTPNQSVLEIKGTISNVNLTTQTFSLGQWIVEYSGASLSLINNTPQNGDYVEVKSMQAIQGNRLIATEVELEDEYPTFGAGEDVELEGVVTAFTNDLQFSVNGQPVVTNSSTRFEYGTSADIKLNSLLEVEGSINASGVLIATEVSIKQSDSDTQSELEGLILNIDQVSRTLILGTSTVLVDNNTRITEEVNDRYISLSFEDLRVNDEIEMYGSRLNDGRILALSIEREQD